MRKLQGARLRSFSWDKGFVIFMDHTTKLTDRGRACLAILAWRYRRQYRITGEEKDFINRWHPELNQVRMEEMQHS